MSSVKLVLKVPYALLMDKLEEELREAVAAGRSSPGYLYTIDISYFFRARLGD